ncbi:TolC family protein [Paraburkholderia hayleyella]|uniref:TolC family protein n=1 Tax=Paraburkholderia hayleyella TaxID=2152889 RepID=UPI00157FC2E6|nr:TolC family protein [Paraburkholderia hayleyella]
MNAKRHQRVLLVWLLSLVSWMPLTAHAWSSLETFDPLGTSRELSAPPLFALKPDANGITPCRFDRPDGEMTLDAAVDRALCHHPQTHRAWAQAQIQAARLGQATAARLPTLSAVLSGSKSQTSTSSESKWEPHSSYSGISRAAELTLEWVLFDFGARSAEVKKAKALLSAANQSLDAATLDVMYATARDYFAALTAQAQVSAARQAETNALQSLAAAEARLAAGVASIADALQARTSLSQVRLGRIKAETAHEEALGTLAIDIGVDPDTPLQLRSMSGAPQPPSSSSSQREAIGTLLEAARTHHPKLLAASAELDAVQASLVSVRAQALPSVRLQGGLTHSHHPMAGAGESGSLRNASHSRYIGLRIHIPFFEGWSSAYRIREAEAQVRLQKAELAGTEQQIVLNVWKSYSAVEAGVQTLQQADTLLQHAGQAFTAAQARYRAGVEGITALLRAQDVLTEARQQRIAAQADWHVARLSLAASLGRLTRDTLIRDP